MAGHFWQMESVLRLTIKFSHSLAKLHHSQDLFKLWLIYDGKEPSVHISKWSSEGGIHHLTIKTRCNNSFITMCESVSRQDVWDFQCWSLKKINPLLTKLSWSRWLDNIVSFLFGTFTDLDFATVHKYGKITLLFITLIWWLTLLLSYYYYYCLLSPWQLWYSLCWLWWIWRPQTESGNSLRSDNVTI